MFDVLIIGAGITGLTAALNLKEKGMSIAVFDKGNGVGGRTATRKLTIGKKKYAFDYGCSGFQLNDIQALNWFSSLNSFAGFPLLKNGSEGLYFQDGMRSFSEWMADSLLAGTENCKLHKRTKITSLEFSEENQTWCIGDSNENWTGKHLMITIPAQQAAEVLKNSSIPNSILSEINTIQYKPSWAVLMTSEQEIPSKLLTEFIHFDPDLISVVDNHRRCVSEGFAYNFNFAQSWSRDYLEATFDQVEYDFIRRWNRKMSDFPIQTLRAHRWRFAFPIVPSSDKEAILSDKTRHLSYGSDALISPDIQGAMLAGLLLSGEF